MHKLIILTIILVLCSISLWQFNTDSKPYTIALLLIGYPTGKILEFLYEHFKYLKVILQSLLIKRIRLSFAYLIRIRDGNRFLLVKSNHIENCFQPPGGVFQYNNEEVDSKFNLTHDTHIKTSPDNDLRKLIKGRYWDFTRFLIWFLSRKNRETSPHREFTEELIDTNILPRDLFNTIAFNERGIKSIKCSFSDHFQIDEIKLFEIFELIPTDEQKKAINNLPNSSSLEYKWCDAETITRKGYNIEDKRSFLLGSHTQYIL